MLLFSNLNLLTGKQTAVGKLPTPYNFIKTDCQKFNIFINHNVIKDAKNQLVLHTLSIFALR